MRSGGFLTAEFPNATSDTPPPTAETQEYNQK